MATSSEGMTLKLHSWRPFYFFVIMSITMLLVPSLLINFWINKVNNEIQREVSGDLHRSMVIGVEKTATSLTPFNQSAINLARVLSSLLSKTNQLHFSIIETVVAPVLFQAKSTIPHLSQASFIGLNGLFFSYYTIGNQLFAVYSNTSLSNLSTLPINYTWYIRPANSLGKLYGEPIKITPRRILDTDWFKKAMKSKKNGYASPGTGWVSDQDDPLILNTVSIGTKGALSLGYPGKSLLEDFLTSITTSVFVHGGGLYISSNDGTAFITQGIPNNRIMVLRDENSLVSVQLLNQNGNQIRIVANLTCSSFPSINGGQSRATTASILKIGKKEYFFQCSSFEILGMPSVDVLALPSTIGRPENIFNYKMKSALFLQILPIGAIAVLVLTSTFLIYRGGRREKGLSAQIIRTKEDIQHAERRSMNTIIAYASASHDVRACLAAITGLIQLCHHQIPPGSTNLKINLQQAEDCTKDLQGILNTVLDSSKIEAGKIQLEEEEFNIEQVIEETVDLYYPVGMKKGVDVVLDTCDGSIRKYSKAKGDRGRIKQILANLLNNAIKFTSEGHISVRVWAKLPAGEPPIGYPAVASSSSSSSSPKKPSSILRRFTPCLPLLRTRHPAAYDQDDKRRDKNSKKAMDDHDEKEGHNNLVEYIFEVNDTGKGIPKEMRNAIFENYVQVVKETTSTASSEHAGTGLGLGIVQSLVRLMGGEIAIVDKELGERGTCFRFNVFLRISGTDPIRVSTGSSPPGDDQVEFDDHYYSSGDSFRQQSSSEQITRAIHSPKVERSQVVLFISGEERRNVLEKLMRRLGIKVSVVKEYQQLPVTLDTIREKIHLTRLTTSSTATPTPVLMVIDTNAGGSFEEISKVVDEFRKEISETFTRVVWIDIPGIGDKNSSRDNNIVQNEEDIIISRPLHGSRAYQVISLIRTESEVRRIDPISNVPIEYSGTVTQGEQEIQEIDDRPFLGKKVLVVDDQLLLRRLAVAILSRLGAETLDCGNGEEALKLVVQDLNHQREHRAHFSPPFDCILMDCEMPIMDGYETSRHIREAEKQFGLHIWIFALTAHARGEEEVMRKITEAGMDYTLFKPLTEEQLLEAMLYMQRVVFIQ